MMEQSVFQDGGDSGFDKRTIHIVRPQILVFLLLWSVRSRRPLWKGSLIGCFSQTYN